MDGKKWIWIALIAFVTEIGYPQGSHVLGGGGNCRPCYIARGGEKAGDYKRCA